MKRYLHCFLAILTLTITFSSVAPAQAQANEGAAGAARTGKIIGRVVNESGQSLANVTVTVRAFGGGAGRTITTDGEGSFQVSDLAPATYLVSGSLPGYIAAPRDPDVSPTAYYYLGDSVRLELIKGGVLTGTVTRSTGEPVVVVTVRAYLVRDGKGQPLRYGSTIREQTTDDRGVYRIYGLPMGTYIVSAGGGNAENRVNVYGTDAPTYAPSSTRDAAAEISVRPGEETTNIDIRYRGEPGHAVSGIATSALAVEPPPGFTITLSSTINGVSQSSYSIYQPSGTRGFSIMGVADGEYDVIAQSFLPGGGWTISETRKIKVKDADISGLELVAKPLGSITGRVVLEESKLPDCQGKRRPLFAETVVSAWHNEKNAPKDQPQFVWGLGGPTLPDKEGAFTLRSLSAGEYRFNLRPEAKYWYLKSISWPASAVPSGQSSSKAPPSSRPFDAAGNWTILKSGERPSGLSITLAEGAASLHGHIDLAEGQKISPRLFVYVVPAEPEKANDILRYFPSLVRADGSFALNNLPPGRYWIIARGAGENESNLLSKLRLPDEAEMRAKLRRDAEAVKIEAELKPCQNVTGYRLPVTSAGRQP